MTSRSVDRRAWCQRIEDGYVVILLFALTQGPVLSLWFHHTGFDLETPATAIRVTYLMVQLPALVLLGRRFGPLRSLPTPATALACLAAWMFLSTAWSQARMHTFDEASALVVTICVGLYLARSFRPERLAALVLVAMQPGLLLSEWASRRSWPAALDFNLDEAWWAGIYLNKNSLGPPAAIGAAAGAVLLVQALRRRGGLSSRSGMVVLAVVIAYDLRILLLTRSKVSLGALGAAAALAVVLMIVHGLGHRRLAFDDGRFAFWTFPVLGAFVGLMVVANERVSSLFGRASGFTGRDIYWSETWQAFIDRPVLGWGWLAPWHAPAFRDQLPLELLGDTWSHSAYLDVLAGGGVLAGALLLAALWSGWSAAVLESISGRTQGAWSLLLVVFVLIASTQESFLIGNHFLFVLLVAAMCVQPDSNTVVERQLSSDAMSSTMRFAERPSP